ncbi:MAG: pyrroloquinoline quinone precursor peptide PqqA [Polyangiales bacterium]
MKNQRQRNNTEPKRGETATAPSRGTWTRPDFTEVLVCAEIGAYAFRAS